MQSFDVLVVGSGLAGLATALHLAKTRKVGLLTKHRLQDGASGWAQGGIAAVMGDDDSTNDHVQDTLGAGAGLCDPDVTRFVVEGAHEEIDWLIALGVPFTRDAQSDSGFHLTREGGHRFRRIIHAADATGRAVQQTLLKHVIAHSNIVALEDSIAVDLITGVKLGQDDRRCYGLYALNQRTGWVDTYAAGHVVLATGGAGKAYLYTTNPDIATGDGIAMGWRAGCRVQNMEFIQFHPTCLYHPQAKSFLISEAVRGEGGVLRLPDAYNRPDTAGERFMPAHDSRAELAPRDIVARAIDFEMKKRGLDCVYLDITHKPEAFLKEHFPTIFESCLSFGIDISLQPIPVVPAAHYTCGGLKVDLRARTDVPHLYAVGETACTGLHGANRLASNSLLECLVFARAAATDILSTQPSPSLTLPPWDESRVTNADEEVVIAHNWDELRRFMWDYVGIVRTNKRLERAAHRISLLEQEIHEYYSNFRVSNDLIELRNLVQTAELIVRCARMRRESRGLHYSLDYPATAPIAENTLLVPDNFSH